jgi:hypothetical protein
LLQAPSLATQPGRLTRRDGASLRSTLDPRFELVDVGLNLPLDGRLNPPRPNLLLATVLLTVVLSGSRADGQSSTGTC